MTNNLPRIFMRKRSLTVCLATALILQLCTAPVFADKIGAAGVRAGGLALCYGILALCAFLILVGYLLLEKKKETTFLLLYAAVFVVNCGYFMRGIANTLPFALFVNAFSYLGAAFSVLLMLLIIIDTCNLLRSKVLTAVLTGITTAVFLLAASGTLGGLYYTSAQLKTIEGVSVLIKEYGPLHTVYPIYLGGYFLMMVASIIRATARKTLPSLKFSVFLTVIVLGNILVWLVEQGSTVHFEFLSVSYIVTTLLLLLVRSMQREYDARLGATLPPQDGSLPTEVETVFEQFAERAKTLSSAERRILGYYIEGHDIAEIPDLAYISINTVKKHNRSIYQKLEIHSRDELMLYIDLFRRCGRLEELAAGAEE